MFVKTVRTIVNDDKSVSTTELIEEASKFLFHDNYEKIGDTIIKAFEVQQKDYQYDGNVVFQKYIPTDDEENTWIYIMNDDGKTIDRYSLEGHTWFFTEDQIRKDDVQRAEAEE